MKVNLEPGNNVVRLYNATGYMPDIDCMELTPVVPSSVGANKSEDNAVVDVYTLGGVPMRQGIAPQSALVGLPKGTYIVGHRVVTKY